MKARCRACGAEVIADNLGALISAVEKHCAKKSKACKPRLGPLSPRVALPVTLVFNRLVASQNKTTYSHWSVHHADRRDWLSRCKVQLGALQGLQAPWSRWQLVRVYSGRNRELDHANLVGGAKPLIDVLTLCGVIVDDSPAHFLCDYQQRRGDQNQTVLTLLEVRDARPADNV